jgi:hypothetical protein
MEKTMSHLRLSARAAARLLATLVVAATAVAAPTAAATAAPRVPTEVGVEAVPDAMTIVERMSRHPHIHLANPVDESPGAVVLGGLCVRLEPVGCRQMVATADASVLVFASSAEARAYAGHADDTATAHGRMVLSFGSPARVRPGAQPAYEKAVRAFRRTHPERRNDAARAVVYLVDRGLLMRDPRLEDRRGERPGRAAQIPGAVDMVATDQADVIVFADGASAREYVGAADDEAARVGRIVLSFGNPQRVVESSQRRYVEVLRELLR